MVVQERSRGNRFLFYLALWATLVLILFPVYWMGVSALRTAGRFETTGLIPTSASLDALISVYRDRDIGLWLLNSTIVAGATALLSALISINAGYAIARYRSWVTGSFGLLILFTQMLPATLLVIPLFVIMRDLQLLNTLGALILANTAFALPLSIWLMAGFFDAVPKDLEEAAQVDGCSRLIAFYRVTLRLAFPGLVVVTVFAFLLGWNDYFFARAFISSDDKWVLAIGLTSFLGEFTVDWPELMAASVIFTIPAVLVFRVVQRHLVSGLTSGAVKG